MRIMSVIGAAVLAAFATMCLAFPAAAASPAEQLSLDRISHELIVAPTFGFAHVDAIVAEPDLFVLAGTGAADKAANCSDSPAWVGIDTPDGIKAERLPACNPRRYDPGWLNG